MSPQAAQQQNSTAETQPEPTSAARAQVAKQDDATVMADTPHALTPQAIHELEEKNKLVSVDRNSISRHERDTNPAFKQKDAKGNYLPVYVMPDVGDQKHTAIVVDLGNGQKAVIANEGAHNWDQDYVNRHIRQSNPGVASNKEYVATEKYTPAAPDEQERFKELTTHVQDAAQAAGMGRTHVIVSNEPGVIDAYSFTSKEGTSYIVIPKKELENGLSSPDQTRKLEQALDGEMPDLARTTRTAKDVLATHEGDKYIASATDKDGKILLPSGADDPKLSQASVDALVKEKSFIPVKASDVDPEVIKEFPPGVPIYLVAGANSDYKATASATQMKTREGKPYIIVDQRLYQQNEAYEKEHVMSTDADMARAEVNGSFTRLDPAIAQKLQMPQGVQVMVNTDDSVTSPYGLQTVEGKNYIILAKADVADAAKSGDAGDLQHMVDKQAEAIQKGAYTPAGLVAADNADKWMAENAPPHGGRPALPDKDVHLGNATLDNLAKTGRIVEMKKEDLTSTAADAIARARDPNGNPLPANTPVYLVPGVNSDGTDEPGGQAMRTREGKYYVLVNEQSHRWTRDDVQQPRDAAIKADTSTPSHEKGLSPAEDALQDVLKGKTPEEAAQIRRRYDELTQTVDQDGTHMGVSKQVILIDNSKEPTPPYASTGAASITSKEGTNYIYMTRDEFTAAITSDKGLADEKLTMGHETSHNAHKHSAPENNLGENKLAQSRDHELRAYLGGEGPLGSNDPLGQAKQYEDFLLQLYNQNHQGQEKQKLTDQEMAEVSQQLVDTHFDAQHPSRWELIQALRYEDQLMKTYDAQYIKDHGHAISDEPPEVQQRIRAAEAQQVEDQAVEYMKDKKQWQDDAPVVIAGNRKQPAEGAQGHGQGEVLADAGKEGAAQPGKNQPDVEQARALFRQHSKQGGHDVDTSAPGFTPLPVATNVQNQQRGVIV